MSTEFWLWYKFAGLICNRGNLDKGPFLKLYDVAEKSHFYVFSYQRLDIFMRESKNLKYSKF